MLFGRSSVLALLSSLALTTVVGCSQSASDGESGASADTTVDASALITIATNLPFEVKRMHPASGPILNAHWGGHGGPEATTADTNPANPPIVTRWFIPTVVNAPAGQQDLKSALPASLPTTSFFWDNDGFSDLSFGGSFSSYSGAGGNFTGEILVYSKGYDSVKARGFVNGFYAGVEVVNGSSGSRLVYSGLSGVTSTAAADTKDGGLWSTDIAATAIGAQPSSKLFGWSGASGPVVSDPDGNVFVAAFLSAPAGTTLPHTDEIYALSKKQALGHDTVTQATVADADVGGVSSLAVASVPASGKGWVFAKGWDSSTPKPIFARAYSVANDVVSSDGDVIAQAITAVDPANTSLSVFGDPKGNLWVAVEAAAGNWLIELAPKAP
jgi:hypothetical protein